MNIFLQHYTGVPTELVWLSVKNMSAYADRVGADYKFLTGDLFHPSLSPPCQKMYMLDEAWDSYEMVIMADTDMFTVNGLSENVFTDITGVGLHTDMTSEIKKKCVKKHPRLCSNHYAYWGGCLWRLDKGLRKRFRERLKTQVTEQDLAAFSGNFEDEGIMHRLAVLDETPQDSIPHRWSYCSYLPNPETAAIIHIRTKISPTGPKRAKMDNYLSLKNRGIIT